MTDENLWVDEFDEENPYADIIKEQEEKAKAEEAVQLQQQQEEELSLKSLLEQLIDSINKTNEQVSKSDDNTKALKEAVDILQSAITLEDGTNIADHIIKSMVDFQGVFAKSGIAQFVVSVDKFAEVFKAQSKQLSGFENNLEERLNRSDEWIAYRQNSQDQNFNRIKTASDKVIAALKEPITTNLNGHDRRAIDNIGESIDKAIAKQKWWWISSGAIILIGIALAVWGVSSKISAVDMEKESDRLYREHVYTWCFWEYMEEWGERNPKSYKSIRQGFENKYPELVKQYSKENQDILKEREGI